MANKPIAFDESQPFEFDENQPFTTEPPSSEARWERVVPETSTRDALNAAANLAGVDPNYKPTLDRDGHPLDEGLLTHVGNTFSDSIEKQGGWGLSDETRKTLGADGPIKFLRPITDLPANVADLGFRALQGLYAGTETVATNVDEALDASGI